MLLGVFGCGIRFCGFLVRLDHLFICLNVILVGGDVLRCVRCFAAEDSEAASDKKKWEELGH